LSTVGVSGEGGTGGTGIGDGVSTFAEVGLSIVRWVTDIRVSDSGGNTGGVSKSTVITRDGGGTSLVTRFANSATSGISTSGGFEAHRLVTVADG